MANLAQGRRSPVKRAVVRAEMLREASQQAAAREAEQAERAERAAWSRATAAAHQRFLCPGCGLNFPLRRAAHPERLPPHRCLCCDFLTTLGDPAIREALRRVLARNEIQCRPGGPNAPPLA
jgi:hypothetical protein